MREREVIGSPFWAQYACIRQKQLLKVVPFSASTLWRLIRLGKFPPPRKLSARVSAWPVSAVEDYLRDQEGSKS